MPIPVPPSPGTGHRMDINRIDAKMRKLDKTHCAAVAKQVTFIIFLIGN